MDCICIVFGIVFCIVGFAFALGKIHIHLTAWKTMPKEEKEKINIVPLCRNIGEVIMLSGLIFLMKGLIESFDNHWFTLTMIAWLVVAGFDIWHISKSKRYQNK